ncbi:MAG: hypothetical protein ACRDRR_16240 [Pseudonocardiaceae bacterium]
MARLTAVTGPEAHRAMYRRAAARLAGEDIPADEPLPRILEWRAIPQAQAGQSHASPDLRPGQAG